MRLLNFEARKHCILFEEVHALVLLIHRFVLERYLTLLPILSLGTVQEEYNAGFIGQRHFYAYEVTDHHDIYPTSILYLLLH
ncbi:hypothetical protein Q648_00167 [Bartonella quintana JK 12]|uniref:Uncharacterized protein n=2 Tax=Bartonella quintana TaxID=803 RepID=W3TWI7_BARQI|nr:hypothetical protein Q651_00336 [Bartonella quintana BQ2-D70]ETS13960.1 hypothetical protein Q650_00579 [Bartonella quintana JK 73rel]ETS15647.1 hypothetical protein Q649_00588 [Bartonella quintana JK 73]ETS17651.1 hypothetical protein Q647_00578 [Bartonella quintana JK 7]ETS18480.1 hypothetical protein Q648_00167 [Bartonella quintana JK 12]KEC59337.1 hypothetical protein O93_00668 [Bartonella quintana JK 19]KEC62556.1 hypothetical protein O7Y_00593 [Bartonella quintana JK 63]KEC63586.1 h